MRNLRRMINGEYGKRKLKKAKLKKTKGLGTSFPMRAFGQTLIGFKSGGLAMTMADLKNLGRRKKS